MNGESVCNCDNVSNPTGTGFTITSDCIKRDIDEGNTDHGDCHTRAECINYDATIGSVFRVCLCPMGWYGHGVKKCGFNRYITNFGIKIDGVVNIDDVALVRELSECGVIPSGTFTSQISVSISATY